MQLEACLVILVILFSNSYEVFQPIQSDLNGAKGNPSSNKAVPLSQMKGGDKVIKVILFLQ